MRQLQCSPLSFPSADGRHTVAAYLYTVPGIPVRAVVQLCHGMCDYVCRYHELAGYLAARGIAVAGNDHLGHGATAPRDELGTGVARHAVLEDLHTMNNKLHGLFPGLPVVLYGHSMGSFYARWYAECWPHSICALILSGTAGPGPGGAMGAALASAIIALRGPNAVSPLLLKAGFGAYNRRIPNASSPNAWVTSNEAVLRSYDADPLCTFAFTAGSFRELGLLLHHVNSPAWFASIPHGLPVLLFAGDADPVGDYGKGVRLVYRRLRLAGVQDVTCRLWRGGRHEMHNEPCRQQVFAFVYDWLAPRLPALSAPAARAAQAVAHAQQAAQA